jgi:selenide, water dikinase
VTLVDAHTEILRGYTAGAIRRARAEMSRRGIDVQLGKRVGRLAGAAQPQLAFDDGAEFTVDIIIWATAASPPDVLANFRLPKDERGFLTVRPTLQTTADFPVFAVGDTAGIVGADLPKAGVYAVREGPVLWENLQRLFAGRDLIPYEPQRGFLSLLSTGDGRAILDYKGFSTHGRRAWQLKDHIDRKFMRMYQDYQPRMETGEETSRMTAVPRQEKSAPLAMRCAGCGGKVGADVLSAALERLNLRHDERVPFGLNRPDDAVVLDRAAAPVDVLSVDFFTAFLDDPYLVGRIAALNALSDLWAMGSDPTDGTLVSTAGRRRPRTARCRRDAVGRPHDRRARTDDRIHRRREARRTATLHQGRIEIG